MVTWVRNLFFMWRLAVPFWCLWWLHESQVLYRDGLTTLDWLSFGVMIIVPPAAVFGLGYGFVRVVEGFIRSSRRLGYKLDPAPRRPSGSAIDSGNGV
jgi:hypothetical protein